MSTRFTKANVEYASAASTPDVTENYTSAGWVKWITNASTSVDDILRVTDNGGDLDIIGAINFFLPNWYLQCYDGYVGGQGQGSATIVEGQWYYVALVRSGGTTYLYVDFEVETSASFDASSRIAATHMRFGGNSDNPSDVELRGWKTFQRALSADEQRAESRADMPLDATALFSVYPFLPGTRDQDYSGNGRTLTETNTPTDGASDPPGVGWGDDLIQVAAPSAAAPAAFDFSLLRRGVRPSETEPEPLRLQRGIEWLAPPPAAAPPFPFQVLRRDRVAETAPDEPRLRRGIEWITPPAAPPPAFPTSLLRHVPRPQDAPVDAPRRGVSIDWGWPAPPPPVNPWVPWMYDARRGAEPDWQRLGPKIEGSRLHDWFPGQAPQALAIVTQGQWSPTVAFLPGEEWRITVSGPAADSPRIRIDAKFET